MNKLWSRGRTVLGVVHAWMPGIIFLLAVIIAYGARTGAGTMNVYYAYLSLFAMLVAIFLLVSSRLDKK